MPIQISPETKNALLEMQIVIGKDITSAIEKQTVTINSSIKEDRKDTRELINGLSKRIDAIEGKTNNLTIRLASLSGGIGVVVWAANKFIG